MINLPSMLSFERKLETSDGLMFAGNWGDNDQQEKWSSISIVKRQNRSTQSAYGIDDIKKTAPNPVSSDSDDANLPIGKDTLCVSFTLRVVGNLGEPFACNKPDFARVIKEKVKAFKVSEGIHDLAFRYAYNIANGRFLWRNRVGAEKVLIQVRLHGDESPLIFNAYDFSLKDFETGSNNEDLKRLANVIREGLASDRESSLAFVKVDAFVKLGDGQHVFPSQEMNMGEKKKKLFQLDGTAAMHNVKIGNAIRTIDTWYGDSMLIKAEGKGKTETVDVDVRVPIAVEPYGSVTQHGRAYRPSKIDLYTLMRSWVNGGEIENNQKKYVVANLIRGGVFGGDSEG
ncbi:type I-F CRISPR-associated protein Csy3 [uncultured Desulfuromusa sp.]|uniref:type I-F CRISPR-associated protein Csy3 n=1 Tax=uncultured Desulfuromusa sp. TaxID=219183 RepID=UPI002AA6E22F|nr:type I-F CRISPR-associated protein Csy3 [uncultured Desulfuromusa sp.]